MKRFLALVGTILTASSLFAVEMPQAKPAVVADTVYNGVDGSVVSFQDMIRNIKPGSVVVVSEYHNVSNHHQKEVQIMNALMQANAGTIVSVGMEFLYVGQQDATDAFVNGTMTEEDYLAAIRWRGNPFSDYREQILFAARSGGRTLAINAPQALTRKISREGLDALTDEERATLPPDFTLGRDLYLQKFLEAMGGGHGIPEASIQRYFAAQSAWDEFMSYNASEYIKQNPNHILVVVVGDFHATYGGGLPDRLKARGVNNVVVISQANIWGLTEEQKRAEVDPHPAYGVRAEYIYISEENTEVAAPKKYGFGFYSDEFFKKLK